MYSDDEPEPETERSKQLRSQLLFSYKVNAATALYLGFSDQSLGYRDQSPDTQDHSLTRETRSFFFKVGYAWVP